MISFLMMLVLAASEPVPPIVRTPEAIASVADTAKPKPPPRPSDQAGRGKPSKPKTPEAQRGKPAPKPTGDPQLKRRKPPALHSPRVP